MEAPITITQRELLLLSPKVCLQVQEVTTTKRVPTENKQPTQTFIVEEEETTKEITPSAFAYQHASHRILPEGLTIIPDPIETYYKSLKHRQ